MALIRFILDEDLSNEIAEIARGLGLDVVSSHELGRDGLKDEEQLDLAATDGRCMVTADVGFSRHTTRFFLEQRPHNGVLIVPTSWGNDSFVRIARAMLRFAEGYAGDSTEYRCTYLS